MSKSADNVTRDNEGRTCLRCAFVCDQQLIGPNGEIQIGQSQLICKRRPPCAIAVTRGSTVSVISSFCPVTADMWCYDFWPLDEPLPGSVLPMDS